jgi:hypothetical protein
VPQAFGRIDGRSCASQPSTQKAVPADDNSALRKIILGGTATNRTLKVPPVNGIKG